MDMASNSLSIDTQNSKVSFEVKKLGILTIKGTLADFHGQVSFDKDKLNQANFNISVGASTIDTGNPKRDEHLKSEDFLHVNEYANISFQSTTVGKANDNYQITGDLCIMGVTKTVSIPFSFSNGAFKGGFTLNRLDYNLGKKFPAFIVGKTISIQINCTTKKA
jgi:polyisoprenoid-binding protein YceI